MHESLRGQETFPPSGAAQTQRPPRAPAEPWRSAIPLRKVFLSPELEHEEGPQNAGVIAAAGHVVAHEALDGSRIEQARRAQAGGCERGAERRRQRAAEPGGERDAEALLVARQDRGRQPIGERAPEKALEPTEPLQAQVRRNAARQLDEPMVEERRAQLEPDRHAGTVGVREVLARQVELARRPPRTGRPAR
jgi:hypothetical protein